MAEQALPHPAPSALKDQEIMLLHTPGSEAAQNLAQLLLPLQWPPFTGSPCNLDPDREQQDPHLVLHLLQLPVAGPQLVAQAVVLELQPCAARSLCGAAWEAPAEAGPQGVAAQAALPATAAAQGSPVPRRLAAARRPRHRPAAGSQRAPPPCGLAAVADAGGAGPCRGALAGSLAPVTESVAARWAVLCSAGPVRSRGDKWPVGSSGCSWCRMQGVRSEGVRLSGELQEIL